MPTLIPERIPQLKSWPTATATSVYTCLCVLLTTLPSSNVIMTLLYCLSFSRFVSSLISMMNFSGDGPQPQIVFLILFRGLKEMVHHCRDQFRPIVKTVVVCAGNLYVPSRWKKLCGHTGCFRIRHLVMFCSDQQYGRLHLVGLRPAV